MTYLYNLVDLLFQAYVFAILVEVISSWVYGAGLRMPPLVSSFIGFVHRITRPLLDPIRRLIPGMGGLDFSPIVALLIVQALRSMVLNALVGAL